MIRTLFSDCAGLPHDPADWSDDQLEEALRESHPQAETELSIRHFMRILQITDRRRIEPDWKLREQKATEATPQPGKRRLSA